MNKIKNFIVKYRFYALIVLILGVATILRFYNFENRWGLSYDQARDVLVSHEALRENKLPLIGPFASAGQFVYGPQWYWILMLLIGVYPSWLLTPWVLQTLLYVGVVLLMILIGHEIQGKRFGLLLGLLTSVSTAQIAQSTNLTSPSMVGILAVVVVYMLIKYLKTGRVVFAFLLGFSIGTSVNVHFQAVGLLVLLPFAIFFGRKDIKRIMSLIIGAIIPFIPLIIFDLTTNFFESKNMLRYYLHDQYKIPYEVLGRRWLTYAGVFWPKAWGHIIGGDSIIGYVQIAVLAIVGIYGFLKKIIPKEVYIIGISFLIMFFLIRYTRTPIFDSYLAFLHPFIIILIGFAIFLLLKRITIVGLILLLLIIGGSIQKNVLEIKGSSNYAALRAKDWKDLLVKTYPNQKFSVYDYGYGSTGFSLPLVLFLDKDEKLADNGYKIGFGSKPKVPIQDHKEIEGNRAGFVLRDLNSSTSAQLKKDGWAFINPSQIYVSTVEWYKK